MIRGALLFALALGLLHSSPNHDARLPFALADSLAPPLYTSAPWLLYRATSSECRNPTHFVVRSTDGAIFASCNNGVVMVVESSVTVLADATQCSNPQTIALRETDGAVLVACATGLRRVVNGTVTPLGGNDGANLLSNCSGIPSGLTTEFQVRPSDGAVFVPCGPRVVELTDSTAAARFSNCSAAQLAVRQSDGSVFAGCFLEGLQALLPNATSPVLLLPLAECRSAALVAVSPRDGVVFVLCRSGEVLASDTTVFRVVIGLSAPASSARVIASFSNPMFPTQLTVRPNDGSAILVDLLQLTDVFSMWLLNGTNARGVDGSCRVNSVGVRASDGAVVAVCDEGYAALLTNATDGVWMPLMATQRSTFRQVDFALDGSALIAGDSELGGLIQLMPAVLTTVVACPPDVELLSVAVRPSDNAVLLACQGAGVQLVASQSATEAISSTVCPSAQSIALVQSDGALVAACSGSGVVRVSSPAAPIVLVNATLCAQPLHILVHPSDGSIFSACDGVGVLKIDTAAHISIVVNSSVCPRPVHLTLAPDELSLVAACGASGVVRVTLSDSPSSPVLMANATVCPAAYRVTFRATDGAVLIACGTGGLLLLPQPLSAAPTVQQLLDPTGRRLCPQVEDVVFVRSARTGIIYLACGSSGIAVFNTADSSVTTVSSACASARQFVAHANAPSGTILYACARRPSSDGGALLSIDTTCARTAGYGLMNGQCSACSPGYAKAINGSICDPCAPGYAMPTPKGGVCAPAPAGSYDPGFLPRMSFVRCPPGSVSSTVSLACTLCPPGRFSGAPGLDRCADCTAGFFASLNGSAACVPCPLVRRNRQVSLLHG